MKLTAWDKQYLINIGYEESDLRQIQEAANKCKYENSETREKYGVRKVLEILPRQEWLTGVARAAFHWSAVRNNINGVGVFFNCYEMFKNIV